MDHLNPIRVLFTNQSNESILLLDLAFHRHTKQIFYNKVSRSALQTFCDSLRISSAGEQY